MTREPVYIGRDNAIVLQLEDNNSGVMANADLSLVTKVELVVDGTTTYDSVVDTTAITYTAGGLLTLKLGLLFSTPGDSAIEIILYSTANPNGIAWQPKLHITAFESLPE